MRFLKFVSIACTILMHGCAVVDQYGGRILDGNLNAQDALNQETLLNVVRASKFQSANFMAVAKVTGGQTQNLSTGLPTISIGPQQTAADGVYKISNSVTSGVSAGYESNPLLSTSFQNAMLSPVSVRTVAQLVAIRPREAVLMLLLDGFTVTLPNGRRVLLKNDPSVEGSSCASKMSGADINRLFLPRSDCSYSRFVQLLKDLIGNGLSAELVSSTSDKAAISGAPGRFCYEPSVAGENFQMQATREFQNICGSNAALKSNLTLNYGTVGLIRVDFIMRSPIGVLAYLGQFLRDPTTPFSGYYSEPAKRLFGRDPRYLHVVSDKGSGCYTSLTYLGKFYCVPATSSHTAMLMDTVQVLRNLSIEPTDLNTSFTLRVAN